MRLLAHLHIVTIDDKALAIEWDANAMADGEKVAKSRLQTGWNGDIEFRVLAEAVPGLVFVTDRDAQCHYTNVHFQRYAGVAAEALAGNGWMNIFHADDKERARQSWTRSTFEFVPYEARFRFRRHDGEFRWHNVQASLVPGSSGSVAQWIGFCFDIEDVVSGVADAISRVPECSEVGGENFAAEIQTTIDALPLIIWEANRVGTIERVNAAWHDCVGGPPPRHPVFRDLIAPDALAQFLWQWDYCVAHSEIMDMGTTIIDRVAGIRAVRALAVPSWLGKAARAQERWIGSFRDQ